MSRNRYHGKPDATLGPIRSALEAAGCAIADLGAVGAGCPDLLVYRAATGLLRLIEAKSKKGKLRASQQAFALRMPVWVARTPDEALAAMGIETA